MYPVSFPCSLLHDKFIWFSFTRGRLKHGRHFTFKNVAGDCAITLVSNGVEGAFVEESHPYAARGQWLQVRGEGSNPQPMEWKSSTITFLSNTVYNLWLSVRNSYPYNLVLQWLLGYSVNRIFIQLLSSFLQFGYPKTTVKKLMPTFFVQ